MEFQWENYGNVSCLVSFHLAVNRLLSAAHPLQLWSVRISAVFWGLQFCLHDHYVLSLPVGWWHVMFAYMRVTIEYFSQNSSYKYESCGPTSSFICFSEIQLRSTHDLTRVIFYRVIQSRPRCSAFLPAFAVQAYPASWRSQGIQAPQKPS